MVIFKTQPVFRYKTIKGTLHKLPAMLKLFLLLPLSIFCMSLSSLWLAAGIIVMSTAAFLCKFTLREQLTDLKPAFFYALLMYALSVFSNVIENMETFTTLNTFHFSLFIFLPRPEFLRISLRLVLIVQLSALLFRSTSAVEIREGLCGIERFIKQLLSRLPVFRKRISLQYRIAENISLFLCFIPQIFENWNAINLAWKARAGKQGLVKIKTVVFVLITLSMEKAALKAKAIEARKI